MNCYKGEEGSAVGSGVKLEIENAVLLRSLSGRRLLPASSLSKAFSGEGFHLLMDPS